MRLRRRLLGWKVRLLTPFSHSTEISDYCAHVDAGVALTATVQRYAATLLAGKLSSLHRCRADTPMPGYAFMGLVASRPSDRYRIHLGSLSPRSRGAYAGESLLPSTSVDNAVDSLPTRGDDD